MCRDSSKTSMATAVLLLTVSIPACLAGHAWNYDLESHSGPHHWEYNCGGSQQSPVSLPSSVPDTVLPLLVLEHYGKVPEVAVLKNNGHSAVLTPQLARPEVTPVMSGGGLGHRYKLAQAHFHWGAVDDRGSEHVIGLTAFPMEMHLVHYKAVHSNIGEALQEGAFDSLAVLAVFFSVQLGGLVHVPSLDTVTAAMENITLAKTKTEVTPFPISDLFPSDMSSFYRYNGSLTTPSCDEIVQWTVLKQPVLISPEQLQPFRKLLDAAGHHLVDNFRPTQPVGSREILHVTTEEPAKLQSAALIDEMTNSTSEELFPDASIIVNSPSGSVQGVESLTEMGTVIYKFKGIPYAEAPVGELRLNDPVAVHPWGGVRDGATDPEVCPQMDGIEKVVGSEDCLYLNVYTPNMKPKNLKPVMIWIHGSSSYLPTPSFNTGEASEEMYNPELLLDEEIVFVSVQYRLGLLGFLSLPGNSKISGNYGLKDQREAMRWVKANIAYYGGDPARVTIFGQSTGAVSVHAHVLAEDDENLFQAAIAQSGTALSTFGQDVLSTSIQAVTSVGCHSEEYSSYDVVNCLQSASLESLLEQPFTAWPVNDKNSKSPIFPFDPSEQLSAGHIKKIPLLVGFNSEDAGNMEYEKVQQMAPSLMKFVYKHRSVQLATDAWFGMPAFHTFVQHGKHAPVYGYILAELCAASESVSPERGVGHGEDLSCIFSRPDRTGGQAMVRSWTNFAKYHQPSPSWDTVPGWHFAKGGQIGIFGDIETAGEGVEDILDRIQLWNKFGRL